MSYDPTKPEPNHNTVKVGLMGLAMAAVMVAIFFSIMVPLQHALNIPVR